MDATYPLLDEEDFPGGVQCYKCLRTIEPGRPYSEHPDQFISNDEISFWVACVYC